MTRFLSYTLCALSLLLPLSASADIQPNTSQPVDLPVNDVVYDSIGKKLYVSVGTGGGSRANTVTAIDPLSGQIGTSIPVGQNPIRLALAPGGKSLYVVTANQTNIERIDLSSRRVVKKWALGLSDFNMPLYVEDIEVMPGHEATVAISLSNSNNNEGVAIYDNGVKRPNPLPSNTGSNAIEFADSSTLWAYNNETSEYGLRRLSVNDTGITEVEVKSVFYGYSNDIRCTSGLLFDDIGRVASNNGVLKGTIPNVSGLPVVRGERVFYCSNGLLSAFDLDTLNLVGTLPVNSGVNSPLVTWGNDGFAWRRWNDGKLVIGRSDLVTAPSPKPLPVPTPRTLRQGLRVWDVPSNDLIWDTARRRLVISTPSTLIDGNANSLLPLDPATGRSDAPIYVGSNPRQMALSDDGKTLYVALEGSGEIRRVDLAAAQAGLRWSLGTSPSGDTLFTEDLEVVPGNPDSVVVSRSNDNFSARHRGVALYENGVQASDVTAVHIGSNVIEFGDGGVLWGGCNESSDFGLRKMSVTSSGVVQQSVIRNVFDQYGFDIRFAAGKIYTSTGSVIDPKTGARIGKFTGGAIYLDVASGRLFVIKGQGYDSTQAAILIYDLTSLQLVGTIPLPEIEGNVASLVRWGESGLAFRTQSDSQGKGTPSVVMVENALVGPRDFLGLSLRSVALKEKAGANATIGTVARSANFTTALKVSLQSDNPTIVVPPTVTIPAGARAVSFNVGVVDDTVITGTQNVVLTALATNFRSIQKSVRVFDDEATLRVTVTPGVFAENVGTSTVRATISRGAALQTPLVLRLASNNPSLVRVRDSFTIPPGKSEVEVALDVIDNFLLDGTKTVTLGASAVEWGSGIARVLVTDDERKPTAPPVGAANPSAPSS